MKTIRYIIFIPIIFFIIYIVFALPPMAINSLTSLSNYWIIFTIFIFFASLALTSSVTGLDLTVFQMLPVIISGLSAKISPNKNFAFYSISIISILLGIDKIIYYWTIPEINDNGLYIFSAIILTCLTIGFVCSIILGSVAENFEEKWFAFKGFIMFIGAWIFKVGMFLILCLLATKICHINSDETYSWYYGIWHGLLVVPHFIVSCFIEDTYCKAPNATIAYSFFWWVFCISSAIRFMPGGGRSRSKLDY